jgi:hypothetical protein
MAMNRNHGVFLVMMALLLCAGQTLAEEGWIKRAVVLRSEQGPAGDGLVNLYKGAKINVQSRDGAWAQIDSEGRTGWIAVDSVSAREVRPDVSMGSSSSAAELSSGAAARGVQPLTDGYSRGRQLNPAGLGQLYDIRASVSAKMLKDFIRDGGIISSKPASRKSTNKEE